MLAPRGGKTSFAFLRLTLAHLYPPKVIQGDPNSPTHRTVACTLDTRWQHVGSLRPHPGAVHLAAITKGRPPRSAPRKHIPGHVDRSYLHVGPRHGHPRPPLARPSAHTMRPTVCRNVLGQKCPWGTAIISRRVGPRFTPPRSRLCLSMRS